jgi:hypothetical protein
MKWEYLTEYNHLYQGELAALGREGWELVGFAVSRDGNFSKDREYIFKRPIALSATKEGLDDG